MTTLPRLTGLGPVIDHRRSELPRSLAGPSVLTTAPLAPTALQGGRPAPGTPPSPETFRLDAAAMEVDRRVRREHMRATIPFEGPSPRGVQDEINRLLRASMSDNGSTKRLRAVHLKIEENAIVLSAAGAAHAVEHWLGDTRLTDAVLAAVEAAVAEA